MKQIWSILLLFGLAQMSFGQLEGPLSGTLGPGEFHVVDTISVEASDTLRLMPGTTLNFDGPYPFHIYGILLAEGAEGNLVVFTTDTSVNHDWWRGLRFIDSTSSGSSLTHCTIEFGWTTDDTACYGGGVYCKRSSPRLANCVIRRNRAWFQDIHHHTYGKGGGVYCDSAAPSFVNCSIANNYGLPGGGGMHCEGSSPTIRHCTLTNNMGGNGGGIYCYKSSPTFANCTISSNSIDYLDMGGLLAHGGGVACYTSSPTFDTCVISRNYGVWGGGLYFTDSSLSTLTNCVIDSNSDEGMYCKNGASPTLIGCLIRENVEQGVFCDAYASPIFQGCTISNNYGLGSYGSGILCWSDCSPIFSDCSIRDNQGWRGAGVYSRDNCSPQFENCSITGNTASGDGGGVFCGENCVSSFENCEISNNFAWGSGGALYCTESSPYFVNCTLGGNSASHDGGGIFCDENTRARLSSCTFQGNSAGQNGGAVYSQAMLLLGFQKCTFSGNSADCGGGVYCDESQPYFWNCTLVNNCADSLGDGIFCWHSSPILYNLIVAFSEGTGIYFCSSVGSQIEYCDVFGNNGGDITFRDDDPSNGPVNIGQLVGTNANGDSCDTYFNIFLNPMFVDTAAGDFHLLAGSPCIDAGHPSFPHDSDGTVTDIGAFYFHQLDAEPLVMSLPTEFALHPNWPNPFNPTTTIRYDVRQSGRVQLTIYNLLGQEVTRLIDSRHLAGTYTASWNADNCPSGIYLCRMEAPGFLQTRKLVLVK